MVFAGLDGTGVEVRERTVGVESVELFLSDDCSQSINDLLALGLVLELVAGCVAGNVVEKFSEVEDFEDLVEGDQSQ